MVGWHHRPSGHRFGLGLGSCGWTGRPGERQSVGSQRVRHDRATELKAKSPDLLEPGSVNPFESHIYHRQITFQKYRPEAVL